MIKITILILLILQSYSSLAQPETTCHTWPMEIAKSWLKDRKIIESENILDASKTQFRKLASEDLKEGLYTDIYFFSFFDKHGKEYDLITQNISSDEECSISEVNIYMVSNFSMAD
ncbi:hypothetical protein [Vibrio aerogenes]|uniref:hypothetical protein n=1 Tax=Vibrio aerogenes TaxID=92172 RepID=UPI0039EF9DEE